MSNILINDLPDIIYVGPDFTGQFLKTKVYNAGYSVHHSYKPFGKGEAKLFSEAYCNGDYIGQARFAHWLARTHRIRFITNTTGMIADVAIGWKGQSKETFAPRYFRIGDKIHRSDSLYVPSNRKDWIEWMRVQYPKHTLNTTPEYITLSPAVGHVRKMKIPTRFGHGIHIIETEKQQQQLARIYASN